MGRQKGTGQRRRWLKRQREWLYLEHFLAVRQLQPQHIIEGQDDGHEPDFTLRLQGQWIGVELTTLPRLRDRIGSHQLRLRRGYWALMRHLGWPFAGTRPQRTLSGQMVDSVIDQQDIDAVMQKKQHRLPHYHERRPLDQVWLLIHTDALQPRGLLQVGEAALQHRSGFDAVWLSRYPLRQLEVIHSRLPHGAGSHTPAQD